MQSGILRQQEQVNNGTIDLVQKYDLLFTKFCELEKRVENLEIEKSNLLKNNNIIKNLDNKLSIVIENYKKSIIVKNKYPDKNTTLPFKEKLKEIGGKWTKNDTITGWLFLGKYDDKKTLEKCAQFIIEEFETGLKNNFEYDIIQN